MNFTVLIDTPANYAESVAYDRCLETIETDFSVLDLLFFLLKVSVPNEILENAPQIDGIEPKSLKIIDFR